MIPVEKVKWFKSYLEKKYVIEPEDLNWEVDQEAKIAYREATQEYGFIDFLYMNVYKMSLEEEKLERYIDILKVISNFEDQILECIGTKEEYLKMNNLLLYKTEQWLEINEDAVNNYMVNKALEREVAE